MYLTPEKVTTKPNIITVHFQSRAVAKFYVFSMFSKMCLNVQFSKGKLKWSILRYIVSLSYFFCTFSKKQLLH